MSKTAKTAADKKVISLKQEIRKREAKVDKHEKKIRALKKAAKKAA
ncbi:MAG: hypothetical protein WCZ66_11145 [Sphingomonadaceae bacterium]